MCVCVMRDIRLKRHTPCPAPLPPACALFLPCLAFVLALSPISAFHVHLLTYLSNASHFRTQQQQQQQLKTGATFGTGITAIKLTALGRPQLLVSPV